MSHPLKRRMARVALLVAAAAPVIGIGATTASAAGLPQVTDLGGLSSTDAASTLGGNVDDATHKAVGVADETGGSAAKNLMPTTGSTLQKAGTTLTPVARKTVSDTSGQIGHVAGQAAKSAQGGQGLTGELPTQGLPTQGLPTQGLPTAQLPTGDLHQGPMLPMNHLPAV